DWATTFVTSRTWTSIVIPVPLSSTRSGSVERPGSVTLAVCLCEGTGASVVDPIGPPDGDGTARFATSGDAGRARSVDTIFRARRDGAPGLGGRLKTHAPPTTKRTARGPPTNAYRRFDLILTLPVRSPLQTNKRKNLRLDQKPPS